MARCLMSGKTSADLQQWIAKWGFTHKGAAQWLGVSVPALRMAMHRDRPLTMQTALLMKCFERHIASETCTKTHGGGA